jgi:hypothetical protein
MTSHPQRSHPSDSPLTLLCEGLPTPHNPRPKVSPTIQTLKIVLPVHPTPNINPVITRQAYRRPIQNANQKIEFSDFLL